MIYYVVGRFYEDPNDQASAINELTKYKLKEGHFATEFVQKLVKGTTSMEMVAAKWRISFYIKVNGHKDFSPMCFKL